MDTRRGSWISSVLAGIAAFLIWYFSDHSFAGSVYRGVVSAVIAWWAMFYYQKVRRRS